jgi:hypothetical protein
MMSLRVDLQSRTRCDRWLSRPGKRGRAVALVPRSWKKSVADETHLATLCRPSAIIGVDISTTTTSNAPARTYHHRHAMHAALSCQQKPDGGSGARCDARLEVPPASTLRRLFAAFGAYLPDASNSLAGLSTNHHVICHPQNSHVQGLGLAARNAGP